MPKEITHLLLADEIVEVCQGGAHQQIHQLAHKYQAAFYFGSVGPDFLYYDIPLPFDNKKLPRGVHWADTIHGAEAEDTMAHLLAMQRILRDDNLGSRVSLSGQPLQPEEKEFLLSFALGYLTHAALDMELHPVVYHYSGDYYADHAGAAKDSVTRHRVIETVLDLYLLDFYGHSYAEFNVQRKIKLVGSRRDLVLRFFTLALRLAYGAGHRPLEEQGGQPVDLANDPLFKTCKRAYSKHLWACRFFQNRVMARLLVGLNRVMGDKLSEYSSLFYPARSYEGYLKKGLAFRIEDVIDYVDPLTGTEQVLNWDVKLKRVIARARRMVSAYYQAYHERLDLQGLRKVLPGASLNNGRLDAPVRNMVHYNPLAVNGSFREVS